MMGKNPRDFWDVTWNAGAGCRPGGVSTGCRECLVLPWLKSHTHKVETIYDGVTKPGKDGRLQWSGKLNALRDGHAAWSLPLTYPGAEHPKLGAGNPSLILVVCMGDLFIARRPTADI